MSPKDPYDDDPYARPRPQKAQERKDTEAALEYHLMNEPAPVGFEALFQKPPAAAPLVPAQHTFPPPPDEFDPLSQEGKFVQHFIRTGRNAVEAARAAGYENPHIAGPALLRKKSVKASIGHVMAAQLTAADLTPGRVAMEIVRVALFDPARLLNEDGTTKPLAELDPDTRAALASVDQGPYGLKVKAHDKMKALSLAVDILGLKQTNVNVNVQGQVDHKINLDSLSKADLDALLGLMSDVIDVEPDPEPK